MKRLYKIHDPGDRIFHEWLTDEEARQWRRGATSVRVCHCGYDACRGNEKGEE